MVDEKEKVFLAYLDERDRMRDGFVDILEFTSTYVKIKTFSNNIITIPMHRVLKIKERGTEDDTDS